MMKYLCLSLAYVVCLTALKVAAEVPQRFVTGLKNPESVCFDPRGVLYVTEIGEPGKTGDGRVIVIEKDQARDFATGLDDPKGIIFYKDAFDVTDRTKIVKIDQQGQLIDFATPNQFPCRPRLLNDIAIDNTAGILLVTDSGDLQGNGGAVCWIDIRLHKITTIADQKIIPTLHTPNGVSCLMVRHRCCLPTSEVATSIAFVCRIVRRKELPVASMSRMESYGTILDVSISHRGRQERYSQFRAQGDSRS